MTIHLAGHSDRAESVFTVPFRAFPVYHCFPFVKKPQITALEEPNNMRRRHKILFLRRDRHGTQDPLRC